MTDAPAAWIIRSGRSGERDSWSVDNGRAGGGFDEVPDLTGATTREALVAIVRAAYPEASDGKVSNFAGQLWALRSRITVGDTIVLPMKTTSQLAIGVAKGAYTYVNDPDPELRHRIDVDWKRTDVPRTAVHQDLLYSLGAFMTVCQIKRNDGAWRLRQILATGVDPGARAETIEAEADDEAIVAGSSGGGAGAAIDLEQAARDQIQSFVASRFAGHGLSTLVAAVLEAEGFFTQVAPPGPDGGIDVFAGKGPLGLDSPRLIVQVKSSPTPVDARVVRELHGVLSTHGAEQALLVAWGGVNKVARQELRSQFFRVRVWDADDLLNAVIRNYDNLSEDLRADLPMKRIWTLVEA